MKKERINLGAGVNYDYAGTRAVRGFNPPVIKQTITARIHEKRTLKGKYYKVFMQSMYDSTFSPVYPQHKYKSHATALAFILNSPRAANFVFDLHEVLM